MMNTPWQAGSFTMLGRGASLLLKLTFMERVYMGTKRNRRTDAKYVADHLEVVELVRQGCPEPEIFLRLGLSRAQVGKHKLEAIAAHELAPEDLHPAHEVCQARSLPKAVRRLMMLESQNGGNTLLKVTADGRGGCHLTFLELHYPKSTKTKTSSCDAGRRI
ncbi:hypothetical protein [Desulfovibrio cuneatus]|uniref:hypothetical protein n=1 Tax=Desulfovibrio cuneatus TaxID=159728 RepID=UPI000482E774|nr:hypothetical protein [Desulfovibrio cuneatus]